MRDKKVYVAAAAFLTITTMVGTVMAGCGSGGSHLDTATGATTRNLTWGGDITSSPTPAASATPVADDGTHTRNLTWGGDITSSPSPAPSATPNPD